MKKWMRKLAQQARTVSVSRLNQTLFKPPPADWREFQITNLHLLVLLNYLGVLELFHKEGGTDSPFVLQSDLVSANPCRSRWGLSKESCSLLIRFSLQASMLLCPPQLGSPFITSLNELWL